MPVRADVSYLYDGSMEGLLCCVFESYEKREIPSDIRTQNAAQMTLYQTREIGTDTTKAERVRRGIVQRGGENAFKLVRLGYLTCHPHRELLILRFVRLSMEKGKKVLDLLSDPAVFELMSAVQALQRECEKFKGFVRFSEHDGVLVSVIEPKNRVLPLLAPHFADRFPMESFMICDLAYGEALLCKGGRHVMTPLANFEMPQANEVEQMYRSLWKTFYDTIEIRQRHNPRCRMNFMPKRYWNHLTEIGESAAPMPIGRGDPIGLDKPKAP